MPPYLSKYTDHSPEALLAHLQNVTHERELGNIYWKSVKPAGVGVTDSVLGDDDDTTCEAFGTTGGGNYLPLPAAPYIEMCFTHIVQRTTPTSGAPSSTPQKIQTVMLLNTMTTPPLPFLNDSVGVGGAAEDGTELELFDAGGTWDIEADFLSASRIWRSARSTIVPVFSTLEIDGQDYNIIKWSYTSSVDVSQTIITYLDRYRMWSEGVNMVWPRYSQQADDSPKVSP